MIFSEIDKLFPPVVNTREGAVALASRHSLKVAAIASVDAGHNSLMVVWLATPEGLVTVARDSFYRDVEGEFVLVDKSLVSVTADGVWPLRRDVRVLFSDPSVLAEAAAATPASHRSVVKSGVRWIDAGRWTAGMSFTSMNHRLASLMEKETAVGPFVDLESGNPVIEMEIRACVSDTGGRVRLRVRPLGSLYGWAESSAALTSFLRRNINIQFDTPWYPGEWVSFSFGVTMGETSYPPDSLVGEILAGAMAARRRRWIIFEKVQSSGSSWGLSRAAYFERGNGVWGAVGRSASAGGSILETPPVPEPGAPSLKFFDRTLPEWRCMRGKASDPEAESDFKTWMRRATVARVLKGGRRP